MESIIKQQKAVFQQALNTFNSYINEWIRKYVLISPIEGKIALVSLIQENQQIEANQIVCYVVPENTQYYSEIVIPQDNFGKVEIGQQVLLKFQSYPFQEYGSIVGRIGFISHISSEKGYLAKVELNNGLTTTYNKQILYRDGLLANAEIITNDTRLIERIYDSFIGQIRR